MSSPNLLQRFRAVRAATEGLVAPLSAEDQQVQAAPDASPSKWHLGHTSWFFERFVLAAHAPGHRPFDARFDYIFNSYYETLGERHARPRRGLLTRPSLDQVRAYRRAVDEGMAALLAPAGGDGLPAGVGDLVELGLHHEQQHQELILTDIKMLFGESPLAPVYRPAPVAAARGSAPLTWRTFDGGLVHAGHAGAGFAFDNETPRHEVFLAPFAIASRLVTAGEYLEFMRDGGYRTPSLWLSDGWAAVNARAWSAPMHWRERDGAWRLFSLAGERAIDPAEPVCHVSHYEADAYARWAGARLPTEFEWEHAHRDVPWAASGFADSARFHPEPAAPGAPFGAEAFGQAWQWTASAYTGYPGFRPAPGAVGEYNGKFMSGQMVLRGASCFTPRSHARATYRNFFPPDARWQMSGLVLARDAAPDASR